MDKPMKRFNFNVLNNKDSSRLDSNLSMQEQIEKRKLEKEIKDSRLDKKEEINQKTKRDLDIDLKKENAKDLLNIQKTSNKKGSNLDNYSLEYKNKHQLRYYSRKEQDSNTTPEGFKIDDVFRDI